MWFRGESLGNMLKILNSNLLPLIYKKYTLIWLEKLYHILGGKMQQKNASLLVKPFSWKYL